MYDGNEKLTFKNKELGGSILNFWSWAYSDLIQNMNRGAFAEFIVLKAMSSQCKESSSRLNCRISMDAYDLLSPEGIRVEVKSSAYIQSWTDNRPAKISFRVAPAKAVDGRGNYSSASKCCRHSDVYVFCVWTAKSKSQNILDLSLWDFYVIATKTLDEKIPNQKTITFNSLLSLRPQKVDYFGIYEAIRTEAMKI